MPLMTLDAYCGEDKRLRRQLELLLEQDQEELKLNSRRPNILAINRFLYKPFGRWLIDPDDFKNLAIGNTALKFGVEVLPDNCVPMKDQPRVSSRGQKSQK